MIKNFVQCVKFAKIRVKSVVLTLNSQMMSNFTPLSIFRFFYTFLIKKLNRFINF